MKDQFNFLKYIKANPLLENIETGAESLESNPKYQELVTAASRYNYYSDMGTHSRYKTGLSQRDRIEAMIKDLIASGVPAAKLKAALERDVKGDARPEDVIRNIGYWFPSRGE